MKGIFQTVGPNGFGTYAIDGARYTRTEADHEGILTPGLVDIHIHGAFGIDFMSASTDEISSLCHRLEEEGYEAWLPTTVTASAKAVGEAIARLPEHPSIAGFHLEGPFISPKYPGAQPPKAIVDPLQIEQEWDAILNDPRLKVITVAPERPGALKLIERLAEQGVVVSMGHTDASYAEAQAGFDAGMRHATHVCNAMRPFHHRDAGALGFALTNEKLRAELIYDRLHVSPDAAALIVRTKAAHHLVAVSDSTMASGMPAGTELKMWGLDCVVGQNEIRLKENGALAGSAITLKTAFQNLAEDFGPEVAIRACCHNPRRALGLGLRPKVQLIWSRDWELVDRIAQN